LRDYGNKDFRNSGIEIGSCSSIPQFLNAPIHNAFNNLMPEKEQNEIL
jgi:hypothetical protein